MFKNIKDALNNINNTDMKIRRKAKKLQSKYIARTKRLTQKSNVVMPNCGVMEDKGQKNLKYLKDKGLIN